MDTEGGPISKIKSGEWGVWRVKVIKGKSAFPTPVPLRGYKCFEEVGNRRPASSGSHFEGREGKKEERRFGIKKQGNETDRGSRPTRGSIPHGVGEKKD